MKRTWMRQAAAATALAVALSLAAPAQASGWAPWAARSGFVQAAWQWITGLWQKAGSCVDPDGRPICQNQSVKGGDGGDMTTGG